MEQTAFFVIGIVLVVIALTVAAIGLRFERFPGSRVAMLLGASLLVLMVAATTTSAVINARDEQKERNEEAEAEQQETETEAEEAGESPKELEEGGTDAQGADLELSAPADGTLAYNTETLEAGAGEVTIEFDNPAAIEHDVTIEQDGEEIAQSELISEDTTEVSADLEPGEYVFYCSVPGHREGGMEGTLTVR